MSRKRSRETKPALEADEETLDKKSTLSHFEQKVIFPPAFALCNLDKGKALQVLEKKIPILPFGLESPNKKKIEGHSTMWNVLKRAAGGPFPPLGEPSAG